MPSTGTTTARGYGYAHQKLRAQWTPKVETGQVNCRRCHQPIKPGQAWDLGHTDDRTSYTGPEHAGRDCPTGGNRNTAHPWRRPTEPHPGLRATP